MKQVIVVRKDLGMRKGKAIAQGAHAVQLSLMAALVDSPRGARQAAKVKEWVENHLMTKICVSVDSEGELFQIRDDAEAAGLHVSLVQDAGLTEFKGPTYTCLVIGPDENTSIDKITGNLKLF